VTRFAILFGASRLAEKLGRIRLYSARFRGRHRALSVASLAAASVLTHRYKRVTGLGLPVTILSLQVVGYRSLLEVIARRLGKKPLLVAMPYGLWHALASVAEMLPEPPITRNQVELMQLDNVASPGAPGFGDLRISSTSLEDALPAIVGLSGGLSSVPPVP
jgi:NADH dehydrogenase